MTYNEVKTPRFICTYTMRFSMLAIITCLVALEASANPLDLEKRPPCCLCDDGRVSRNALQVDARS